MKKIIAIFLATLLVLAGLSVFNAHGVDVTADKMVIANDSNGQLVKDIADENGLNISVYKFTSEDEVEHQLEHMLNNSNKNILVVSYQDVAKEFLNAHADVSDRLIIIDDVNNDTLKEEMTKIVNKENTNEGNSNLTGTMIVGVVVGIIVGISLAILIVRRKK